MPFQASVVFLQPLQSFQESFGVDGKSSFLFDNWF